MDENSSPVLNINTPPTEEKITGKAKLATLYCGISIFVLFFILELVLSISTLKIGYWILTLVCVLIFICFLCRVKSGYEIIINNSNRTMTLIKKNLCKCCGPSQETIDLNQVTKLHIYRKLITTHYEFCYKDGSSKGVTNFFKKWVKKDLNNCLKILEKYFVIDCEIPEFKSAIELNNTDSCSNSNSRTVHILNTMPNQINNKSPQNYNDGIPQNIQQSYSSGNVIYAKVFNGYNTSYPKQSNL